VACAAALVAASAWLPAYASVVITPVPALYYNASAQVYSYYNTSYSSPILGDINFGFYGKDSAYKYNSSGSGLATTGVASLSSGIPAGHSGGGDPVYDIVTSGGQYGFSYQGQAEAAGTTLRTQIAGSVTDSGGNPVSAGLTTTQSAYSYASYNQGFYIPSTASKSTGTYGAIVVSITLDGMFPAVAIGNNSSANLNANSSFTDSFGVSYSSYFGTSTYAGDPNWTGSITVQKKLLFQYGTVFNVNLYQYASASNNGSADFFNTGKITAIEIPYQATLYSGAEQAGLGSVGALYGDVFQSATADAGNTNWDFGNNGGGITPTVPEPETYALMLAGLGVLGLLARRRRAA
jgi:hypothetical protein